MKSKQRQVHRGYQGSLTQRHQLENDANDQQPWRCVTCGEAVNKTTKRDCRCTREVGLAP